MKTIARETSKEIAKETSKEQKLDEFLKIELEEKILFPHLEVVRKNQYYFSDEIDKDPTVHYSHTSQVNKIQISFASVLQQAQECMRCTSE